MAHVVKRPTNKGKLVKRYQEFIPYITTKSIQQLPNKKTRPNGGGIYALYDKYGLYYVGLTTTSIRSRVRRHAVSKKHRGKWERFSWYHIPSIKNVKDIESILIRIVRPRGNLVNGRFPRSARAAVE
jgi:hypothetical protein